MQMNVSGNGDLTAQLDDLRRSLILVQWSENVVNMTLSAYFVRCISRTALIHPNMRTWVIVMPAVLYTTARVSFQLRFSSWLAGPDGSGAVLAYAACAVGRLMQSLANGAASSSILLLGIERLLATIFCKTYEQRGNLFAIILNLATYSISAVTGIVHMVRHPDVYDPKTFECVELSGSQMVALWIYGTVLCDVSIVLMVWLYRWNKRQIGRWLIVQRTHNLATRYQYAENIATTRALLPGIVPYAILSFMGLPFSVYLVLRFDNDDPFGIAVTRLYTQVLYLMADMYSFMSKTLFLCQYAPLRAQVRKDTRNIRRLCRGNAGAVDDDNRAARRPQDDPRITTQTYFNQLEADWQSRRLERPRKQNGAI